MFRRNNWVLIAPSDKQHHFTQRTGRSFIFISKTIIMLEIILSVAIEGRNIYYVVKLKVFRKAPPDPERSVVFRADTLGLSFVPSFK